MAENLQQRADEETAASAEKNIHTEAKSSSPETSMPPPPAPSDTKVHMKFSLKSSSSSSSAARPPLFPRTVKTQENEVEYVTEFDGKGRKPSDGPVKVIPLLENSWRPEKRMKNIMIESDLLTSTEERFETDSLSVGPKPSVQYGLVMRKGSDLVAKRGDEDGKGSNLVAKDGNEDEHRKGSQFVSKEEDGTVNGNRNGYEDLVENSEDSLVSFQERELRKFREEVASLPEETSMEAYENVSVEDFGEALLRGMGWEKGKPIGRNCTTVAAPIERVRRVGREGLGAIPAPKPEKVQKYRKPGEHKKTKFSIGRVMCLISGKYSGFRGQIAEVKGDSYTIALIDGGKRIVVRREELAEVGSLEEEKAIQKLHNERDGLSAKEGTRDKYGNKEKKREELTSKSSSKENEQSKGSRKKYDDDGGDGREGEYRNREDDIYSGDRHKSKRDGKEEKRNYEKRKYDDLKNSQKRMDEDILEESKSVAKSTQSWLTRDIRVKVIHKTEYGGKWYLQKGCIIDVISPSICDVKMDDGGKILQDVKEEHLETALPKGGGRVLVVGGKHRGQIGRLQERISDKGVGIVQIDETYELFTLDLDHLAEFVGTKD